MDIRFIVNLCLSSHRCMETTPSLACANKCVFCWRHHSNPVGTEWRWKMDPAEFILEGALEQHAKMINQFKGFHTFNCVFNNRNNILSHVFYIFKPIDLIFRCSGCPASTFSRRNESCSLCPFTCR